MKTKLHLGLFIVLFVIIGRKVDGNIVPNQQIIVKFSNLETLDVAQTIEKVKVQLRKIGVSNIKTEKDQSGFLKITYYSASSINEVQEFFLKQTEFKLIYEFGNKKLNHLPQKSSDKNYEFNISKILKTPDNSGDFNGIEVVEHHQKSDRFQKNKVYEIVCLHNYTNLALKYNLLFINKSIALTNKYSYKIPEVRAGPNTLRKNIFLHLSA